MDSGSDDDEECGGIPLSVGLSAATLAALMQFAPQNDKGEEGENKVSIDQRRPDPERFPTDFEATHVSNAIEVLARDGVVRLDNLLSLELCGRCREHINSALARVEAGADQFIDGQETGFGNVDSKECRWDMYLDHEGAIEESLSSILHPTADAGVFFERLFGGQDSEFYELSSLISDPSALSQRVHTDTTHQPKCPLYTVFVALQDISSDMGPTVFIPGTHTSEAHSSLRHNRDQFLASASYKRALLRAGDAVVMDSRAMHCGDGNSESRRVLMYFTLRGREQREQKGADVFHTAGTGTARA
eukprot:CAMPEP_0173272696 /NCGR_PEP_ID=MMETSP1143-20121109/1501_1 /TAXON_ID=483371 /ORGANISM="non described non described, Strain CCMP2298" /LENGTH=302 /DNA_ID=CAMNT_0014209371 /DNA_START=33 /DNA_END=938 /DNA_ORIENTATION=+